MKIQKSFPIALLFLALLLLFPMGASASTRVTASVTPKKSGIQLQKVEYDVSNKLPKIEVSFLSRVSWKLNAKVKSVKDNKGTRYKAELFDRDSDDCDIVIPKLKAGRTYTIKISGIKKARSSKWQTITLKVKIPADSKKIGVSSVNVEYDPDSMYDYEVTVRFNCAVQWKASADVTSVKASGEKARDAVLTDRDDRDCEIHVNSLTPGKTYAIKISGIKARGASSYGTITVNAKVPPKSSALKVRLVTYDVDYEDNEYTVSFAFNKCLAMGNRPTVIIRDAAGKAYSSKSSYVECDHDDCEVYLSKPLTHGKTYSYEISNIQGYGDTGSATLKGSFKAVDDDYYDYDD